VVVPFEMLEGHRAGYSGIHHLSAIPARIRALMIFFSLITVLRLSVSIVTTVF
jgi:hypothetical protein